MKAWTIAAAALSLTALCACSSTEEETAPPPNAKAEDVWSYHIKKAHPQWQQPGDAPAPTAAATPKCNACPGDAAAPAAQQPWLPADAASKDAQCQENMKQLAAPLAAAQAAKAPAAAPAPVAAPAAAEAGLPAASVKPVPANTVFAEPPGFVVNNNTGRYVAPTPEPAAPVKAVEPAKPEPPAHYIVKEGDSLWKISKLVYHSGEKWERIYEANKGVIKNPNFVKPGTELKIPAP